jgi:hypothetical protein
MSEQNLRKSPDGMSEYMLGKMSDGMSGYMSDIVRQKVR